MFLACGKKRELPKGALTMENFPVTGTGKGFA